MSIWYFCTYFLLILFLTSILVLKKLKNRIVSTILINKLPSPKGLPILGHFFVILLDDDMFFKNCREWAKKYGPMYALSSTFLFASINITGAEEFEKIASTTKNTKKSTEYIFFKRWLGQGLLTSSGSKWQTRRKILTPAFHFNILQQFLKIFNKETNRLVANLEKETDKYYTNIVPLVSQFTLFSITETSMGTTLDINNEEDKNYISAIHQIGPIIFRRMIKPWLFFDIIHELFPSGRLEMKLVKILHSFTNNIISKRAKTFEAIEYEKENRYMSSKKNRLVFLDLMLDAKLKDRFIDDEGIRDEVNTFLFEGHDTTAMSICFTLMLLANHEHYQQMIYNELMSVYGDFKDDPDIKDLNELKIMERCIKESLRLYPSVAFIARTLDDDMFLKGYILPKKSVVHIWIYDIHRDPKYWPDPEKFDPDRFLPENCINRHPFAYIPFSAGPRNCIGQKFAMLEMKAVLCGILKNFILKPVDTPETIVLKSDVVLRTKDTKLRMKFCKRST